MKEQVPNLLGWQPPTPPEVCITCSDQGLVGRVVSLDPPQADYDGVVEEVDISLVTPVEVGDLILVHATVALTKVEPNE